MNARAIRYLDDLREALSTDSRFLALQRAEKALEGSPKAKELALSCQKARGRYLTLRVELGEEDEETRLALKAFHQAKLALDLEPSAKEYNEAYALCRALLQELDETLFGGLKEKRLCGGRHD